MQISMTYDDLVAMLSKQYAYQFAGFKVDEISLDDKGIVIGFVPYDEDDEEEVASSSPNSNIGARKPNPKNAKPKASGEDFFSVTTPGAGDVDPDEDEDSQDVDQDESQEDAEEDAEEEEPVAAPAPAKARTSLFADLKKPVNRKK